LNFLQFLSATLGAYGYLVTTTLQRDRDKQTKETEVCTWFQNTCTEEAGQYRVTKYCWWCHNCVHCVRIPATEYSWERLL